MHFIHSMQYEILTYVPTINTEDRLALSDLQYASQPSGIKLKCYTKSI
jgi:hypothetical protein